MSEPSYSLHLACTFFVRFCGRAREEEDHKLTVHRQNIQKKALQMSYVCTELQILTMLFGEKVVYCFTG